MKLSSHCLIVSLFGVFTCFSAGRVVAQQVTLLFAGDAMQHQSQLDNAYRNGKYDYSSYFRYLRNELAAADLAVVNLEVTLGGTPYRGYPQFSAPDEYAYSLKEAGFSVFLNANNHIVDRGNQGLLRTLNVLESMQVEHTGVFRNIEERESSYPLMLEREGIRFAILNYTYGTNGYTALPPLCVNYIDKEQIHQDVQKAMSLNADMIIAAMHWGDEYKLIQNREQEDLANFLVNEGVDLIIGSHPHVVQPTQLITNFRNGKSHLVVFSLGNFVSGMVAPNTYGGQMVKVVVEKQDFGLIRIKSAEYALVYRHKERKGNKTDFTLVPVSLAETSDTIPPLIELDAASYQKMMEFTGSARKLFDRRNIGINEYRVRTSPPPEKNNYLKFMPPKFAQ